MCEFLCQLRARGYQPLFLTARAMLGPAGIERTRRYRLETLILTLTLTLTLTPTLAPTLTLPLTLPLTSYLFEIAVDKESGYRLPQAPLFTTRHTSTLAALREELGLGTGGGSKAFKLAQLSEIQVSK